MIIQTLIYVTDNHKMISHRLLRNKTLSSKVVTRSKTIIVHDCPTTSLNIVTPQQHGYKRFLHLHKTQSKAYHADNGRFADQGFRDDCMQNNQIITFCGVESHHQNGIAERKIKHLMLCTRTMLLHAKRMLHEYFNYSLAFCIEMRRRSNEQSCSSSRWTNSISDTHWFGSSQA